MVIIGNTVFRNKYILFFFLKNIRRGESNAFCIVTDKVGFERTKLLNLVLAESFFSFFK